MKRKLLMLLIAALPLIYFLINLGSLPDQVVTHWNVYGEADRYGSKYFYLILASLPIIIVSVDHLLENATGSKRNKKLSAQALTLITIGFSSLAIVFIKNATSESIEFLNGLVIGFGLLFIYFGNISNKIEQNAVFGIRLPYTLRNEKVWNRTHYIGGYLFFITGVLTVISGLLLNNPLYQVLLMTTCIVLSIIFLTFYSRNLYIKETKWHEKNQL
ncbi:SdpI family protein [Mollicutes bacterium LVI A0039]|nr:SdpI family protein [Mollicutes bacterium LVI A0039]